MRRDVDVESASLSRNYIDCAVASPVLALSAALSLTSLSSDAFRKIDYKVVSDCDCPRLLICWHV